MGDAAQDRYDVYKDSIGEARRPLKDHVRHLFEQTTERDAGVDSTRAERDHGKSRDASVPVPNRRHKTQKAKRAK